MRDSGGVSATRMIVLFVVVWLGTTLAVGIFVLGMPAPWTL